MSSQDRLPEIPLGADMVDFAAYLNKAADYIAGDGIEHLRAGTRKLRDDAKRDIPPVHAIEEASFQGLRYRIIRPNATAQRPAAIYLHGGGWSHLDIDVYDPIIRRIALESGHAVAAIDFPLIPDVQFPANLEACVGFIRHVANLAPDAGSLSLLGDSAGANLALSAALVLRDAGRPLVNSLGLIYGAFDLENESQSYGRHGNGSTPLTVQDIRKSRALYMPDQARRSDPLVSPIRADLRGLPPVFLAVASHDPLYDENIAMASKLGQSGGVVTLKVYANTIHGFLEAESVNGSPAARQALRDLGRFVADHSR